MTDNYKPIPVSVAMETGEKFDKDQVLIFAWDRKSGLLHSTTWGRTMPDKAQAAQGSEFLMKCLGGDLERKEIFEDKLGLLSYKEICICAAIRLRDGRIFRGHRHNHCISTMISALTGEPGELAKNFEQGFITSRNRFVDRKEGRKLQEFAGIPSADKTGYRGDILFSEDLY